VKKVTLAPFALASDGTVFLNVAHVRGDVAMMKIMQQARRMVGGRLGRARRSRTSSTRSR
jgi:hypothetical protein